MRRISNRLKREIALVAGCNYYFWWDFYIRKVEAESGK